MRIRRLATAICGSCAAVLLATAVSAAPTGREIMERVDARDDGDNAVQDTEMVLIDKGGSKRVRRIRSFRRVWDGDSGRA